MRAQILKDDEIRWYMLEKKRKEISVGEIFKILRSLQIEPILIKGLASALLYPSDVPRYFADTDLAVSSIDYSRIAEFRGSRLLSDLNVDFHHELRQLDSVPWEDLYSNSITVDFNGTDVRILRSEDHLRVICVHWLTDGGAREDRLWDVFYAVQNRPHSFDWKRCLDIVSATRRQWIITALGIAHYYLQLPIEDLPFSREIGPPPAWIQRCLESEWKSGTRMTDIPSFRLAPTSFFKQIAKRIPPNPISATIECEGRFGNYLPVKYQFRRFIEILMERDQN